VTPKQDRSTESRNTTKEPDLSGAPAAPPPPPSRRGLLLVAMGLLAAGLAVALVAVFYRPDYVVLVPFDEPEEAWFRARIADFAEKHHVRLTTRAYANEDELERLVRAETLERKRRVLVALAPRAALAPLSEDDLVLPTDDVRGTPRARALAAAMAPEAIAPAAARGGGLRFVPASISTPLLFYSRARVAEAVAGWESDRARIDAALRRAGGSGLPQQYRLEADPNDWDTFDIAVLAAWWADRPYDGLRGPRIAHAAIGDAATVDLATRAFSQGVTAADLLDLDAVQLRDALAWESVFFAAGWYHPGMMKQNWEPNGLLSAAAQGQVFLGWLDMPRLFRLHGTGAPGLEGVLKDPADLGVARVPRGVSLDLAKSLPARGGDSRAALDGSWWTVPRTTPDAPLAFELVELLSGREFQADWARAFGRLPARRDLLAELDLLFETDWQFTIARIAKKQALDRGRTQPGTIRWRNNGRALVAAWREMCVEKETTNLLALGMALERHAGAVAAGHRSAPADSAKRGD